MSSEELRQLKEKEGLTYIELGIRVGLTGATVYGRLNPLEKAANRKYVKKFRASKKGKLYAKKYYGSDAYKKSVAKYTHSEKGIVNKRHYGHKKYKIHKKSTIDNCPKCKTNSVMITQI